MTEKGHAHPKNTISFPMATREGENKNSPGTKGRAAQREKRSKN